MPTDGGFPVVYADSSAASDDRDPGPGAGAGTGAGTSDGRTLICYNHYDVQPEEPVDLWLSPPFEPTEREGRLYARGVSDDKGQLISRIAAMRAIRAVSGGLPVRVKFLVEGEEEIGSIHLPAFVEAHRELLAADACVWESGGVNAEGAPTVQLGMRGILAVELRVRTLSRDAHSGQAHNLPNAAWRLVRALASLKDEHERILIAGWYDDVREPSETERRLLELMPSDEEVARELYGVREFVKGHTGLEYKAAVYAPTCNIAGIGAGWQGPGSKTVIPALAMAKLDFRLVPDQDPLDLLAKLRRHLDAHGFIDVEVGNTEGGGERSATTPPDDSFVRLAARTAEEVYGRPAVLVPLVGGSGPMWAFRSVLGTPIVTLGTSDPYTSVHAPNESISLERFAQGIRHMARLLLAYGEEAGSGA
jgi:acetylornithine deacetylase/succinyl-diaminopimelate desuccinylase-like protein